MFAAMRNGAPWSWQTLVMAVNEQAGMSDVGSALLPAEEVIGGRSPLQALDQAGPSIQRTWEGTGSLTRVPCSVQIEKTARTLTVTPLG